TILAIILGSDKTHLTNFSGDKKMHPIYLSLGNIHKSIRNKPTKRAWCLLANLPISKFSSQEFDESHLADESKGMPSLLQKILYHECLRIILRPLRNHSGLKGPIVPVPLLDAHGMIRMCVPILMAWIADLEEVLDLLGLRRNRCPKCIAGYEDLGGNQVGANPTPT
ncbi:uncharacterized protein EI90DRAFT_2926108, partial [Cantharellus anzutake]|uniref:uncharacterized protein n=1 Tax=Cantharellus anzutake TaxID=1750568 RepID=UPI0019051A62